MVRLGLFLALMPESFCLAFLKADEHTEHSPVGEEPPIATAFGSFASKYCAKCHAGSENEGGFNLEQLGTEFVDRDAELWLKVAERIDQGEMPPADALQPAAAETKRLVRAISRTLRNTGKYVGDLGYGPTGNHLSHELLFTAPITAPLDNPPRLWRLSPQLYFSVLGAWNSGDNPLSQSMGTPGGLGFQDMAANKTIDQGTLATIMRNASHIARVCSAHKIENGKVVESYGGLGPLLDPAAPADRGTFNLVFGNFRGYRRLEGMPPEQADALYELYTKTWKQGGPAVAVRACVTAYLMEPESLFRLELGQGPIDDQGRRRLSTAEIATAISAALTDSHIDFGLYGRAREKKSLETKEGVAAEVRAALDLPLDKNARVLRFFQEYFAYTSAPSVFKDETTFFAQTLVNDTAKVVSRVLERDKDVLKEILTTRMAHIDPHYPKTTTYRAYNLAGWPESAHFTELPATERKGILTQPSWLVARSQNFNNDVVRRGKWVRERLLGGAISEVPVTVCAMLSNDKSLSLRERLKMTQEDYCWQCHKKMNPLGFPFEQWDHFGRFRRTETVEDPTQPLIPGNDPNVDPPRPATKEVSLDTTGAIEFTGDPTLDGPVKDADEMIERLANSTRVRQVFVRHAFRYWLGREENLGDAPSLREADEAYVKSGGSMKALITALLSSDSFLYRTVPTDE